MVKLLRLEHNIHMSRRYEQVGLGFDFEQGDNSPMEIKSEFGHETIDHDSIVAALLREKNNFADVEAPTVGKLIAVKSPNLKSGYVFHTLREVNDQDLNNGRRAGELIRTELTYEEQLLCQRLLSEIDVSKLQDDSILDAEIISDSKEVQIEEDRSDDRVGVWHGKRGTENLLVYKDGLDTEDE